MNRHLSTAQISDWIAGERAVESERHLHECAACRSEVSGFESGLTRFGQSMRYWAAQQNLAPRFGITAQSSTAGVFWRWRWAGVAIGAIAFLPFLRNTPTHRDIALQEDAELLAHIDVQLSRAVPATMEPLMNLMEERKDEHE